MLSHLPYSSICEEIRHSCKKPLHFDSLTSLISLASLIRIKRGIIVDIIMADVFGRSAPDQEKSGHSQFAPLKLRSLTVVPSSGAQCAPPNFTYGNFTARLFLPGCATPVTDSRSFRAPAPPVPYASVCTSIEESTCSRAGARKRSACGWFIPTRRNLRLPAQ